MPQSYKQMVLKVLILMFFQFRLMFLIFLFLMQKDNGKQVQILFVGSGGTGKTTFCKLITNKESNNKNGLYQATTGIQTFFNPNINLEFQLINNVQVTYKILDSPGMERYRFDLERYIRGSDIIIFVFSIDDKQSFEDLEKQIRTNPYLAEQYLRKHCQFYIYGNKMDRRDDVISSTIEQYVSYRIIKSKKIQSLKCLPESRVVGHSLGSLRNLKDRQKLIKQVQKMAKRGYCCREFNKDTFSQMD